MKLQSKTSEENHPRVPIKRHKEMQSAGFNVLHGDQSYLSIRHTVSPAANAYDLPTKQHDREERAYTFGYRPPKLFVEVTPGPTQYELPTYRAQRRNSFSKSVRFPQIYPSLPIASSAAAFSTTPELATRPTFSKALKYTQGFVKDDSPGPESYEMPNPKFYQQFNKSTKMGPPPKALSCSFGSCETTQQNTIGISNYLFPEKHRGGRFLKSKRFDEVKINSSHELPCIAYKSPARLRGGRFSLAQ